MIRAVVKDGTRPEPLPPETRTVGQVVAEAMRLYGRRFWHSLALGVGPAALELGRIELPRPVRELFVLGAGPLLLSASHVGAPLLAREERRGRVALPLTVGVPAFVPLVVSRLYVSPAIYLFSLAWFALLALAVPAVLVEGRGVAAAYPRAVRLARADYVHALGAVAALAIVIVVSLVALLVLLTGFGDQGGRTAAFLALLVLSPVFFLGAALLYDDQAARERLRGARALGGEPTR